MGAASGFVTALRLSHPLARLGLLRDTGPYLRLHFLYAALRSGLLEALRAPASQEELAQRLHAKRPELLESLLDLGVALKELGRSDGRYRIRGSRSKALVAEDGDPMAALVEELVAYHASVYRHFDERLRGAELGHYLDEHGVLIARSSRLLESFVANFVRSVVRSGEPVRLLEVGFGSGVYLRHAREANPQLTGVGIDLHDDVVERARANLTAWGIGEAFQLLAGDVRNPPPELAGPFDLITLYNNVYYFQSDERPELFQRIRSWLAPDGVFALVSIMRSTTAAGIDFDLALRSTVGCTALPDLNELIEELRASGFSQVQTTKLMPMEPLYGVLATP